MSNSSTSEVVSRLSGSVRKAFTGYYRKKDFIRRVRGCKTAAEERAMVAVESAAIRDSFKSSRVGREQRYHSLAKLVYIYLMGYPAIFGQVECMKLAAVGGENVRVKDKRLGYLGVSLLSDEHQETLTLVTNSLKFDLNSDLESVKALALNSLSVLASEGMARELAVEVDALVSAPSAIIRKKAVACAVKLVQKDPELIEIFEARLTSLLSDKNHAVQLAAVVLFQTILAWCPHRHQIDPQFLKLLPMLVRILQSLQTAPLDTEYDVSGVSDPLLQVSLLRCIRQLSTLILASGGALEAEALNSLNDLLAQLATTLETGKNVGNAVLYEVVLTVMALPVDQSLVNLAIGMLGKFLGGNSCGDNNLRYVALNLLTKIIQNEIDNVKKTSKSTTTILQIQKHQSTILACLHDADSTIRKKAADLSLLLIQNSSDLAQITPALLKMCQRIKNNNSNGGRNNSSSNDSNNTENEIIFKLSKAIQRFSSSRDSILSLNLYISLLKSVDFAHPQKNEIVSEFIRTSNKKFPPAQTLRELFFALTIIEEPEKRAEVDENCNEDSINAASASNSSLLVEKPKICLPSAALLESAFWYFGEFGQLVSLESLCSSADLVALLAAFSTHKRSIATYALTALAKLSTRLPDQIEAIKVALQEALRHFTQTRQFDLIDRTAELLQLIHSPESVRKIIFEPIKMKFDEAELDIENDKTNDEGSKHESTNDNNADNAKDDNNLIVDDNPDLIINHLDVFIDQAQVTSPTSLQLQLLFKSSQVLENVNIALAVPRDFDFDYLAPASSTSLNPENPEIALSIIVSKKQPQNSVNLLDFEEAPLKVDWNAQCKIKIKANYTLNSEKYQEISQLPKVI